MTDRPVVAVLDYGSGNVHSAVKALVAAGADARLTSDRALVQDADGLVVPGVGAYAHVAAMSLVIKDVPSYLTAAGNPATAVGLNLEGLRRRGFEADVLRHIRDAYKVVYRSGLKAEEACDRLADVAGQVPEVARFVDDVRGSRWGIVRPRGRRGDEA